MGGHRKVSSLRALRERRKTGPSRGPKMPERGGPQQLVLIFGEFEQKQVVFFLGPGNQSFQIGDPHFGVEFLVGNLLTQDCDIEERPAFRAKPKAKSEFGVLLFSKRDFRSSPALLTISGNSTSLAGVGR